MQQNGCCAAAARLLLMAPVGSDLGPAFGPSSPIVQGEMPDEATIRRLIRKGTIAQAFVPIVCGTAFKNKGVQPLLDAVVEYLPSPLDIEAVQVRPASLRSSETGGVI